EQWLVRGDLGWRALAASSRAIIVFALVAVLLKILILFFGILLVIDDWSEQRSVLIANDEPSLVAAALLKCAADRCERMRLLSQAVSEARQQAIDLSIQVLHT